MRYRNTRSLFAAAAMAVVTLCVADPKPASAQQQPVPVVLGVVDADGILQTSKAGLSLKAQADPKLKAINSDFEKQQKQWNDARRKLAAQQGTLSADDLKKKAQDLQQQADQEGKALTERRRVLDDSIAKSKDQIVQALIDVVKDVAKAHGLTIVVLRSATPYFDPSYDISPEVKQKLDAKLPSVKLQQVSSSDQQ
jgi:Skp family chaperone for outer membrane proteins